MTRRGVRSSILAVLFAILFLPVAVSAQEITGEANPAAYPEGLVHEVVKGDTLWDLSEKYLGSPWLWPELWERNRFITNPHYIYPGISVVVYPPPPREYAWEVREPAPAPEEKTIAAMKPAGEGPQGPATPPEQAPVKTALQIAPEEFVQGGEFVPERPVGIGQIIGGVEDRDAFSEQDTVYLSLSKDIPEDQILGVYRVRGPVRSATPRPVSGYVRYLVGILQVTGRQDGQITAIVKKSFADLGREDLISEEIPSYSPVHLKEGKSGIEAFVITGRYRKVALATYDFVYLDQGSDAGVDVGDVYRIFVRRSDPTWYRDTRVPGVRVPVGEVVIVRVLPGSATAYVTQSTNDIPEGAIAQTASAESR